MDFDNFGKNENLLTIQKQQITKLLQGEDNLECQWKVLILDRFSQEILSTLFKRGNLFDLNVTLTSLITDKRDKLPGVNVIYLIYPNQENFKMIVRDFKNDLYDKVFLHFTSQVSNEMLKDLGNQLQGIGCLGKIQLVYENYFQYVSLYDNLFISNQDDVYQQLQLAKTKGKDVTEVYKKSAESLQSIVKAFKAKPICFYQGENNGQIIEHLKVLLNQQEQIQDDQNSISSDDEQNQVGLILLERDIDLNPCIMHPSYYGSMIHDLFNIRLNKIHLKETRDLDAVNDQFWRSNITQVIPDVLDNHSKDVENFKVEYQKLQENTDDLTQKLDSVPKNTEWKLKIDIHSAICDNFLNQALQVRAYNKFEWVEEDFVYKGGLTKENKAHYQELLEAPVREESHQEYLRQFDLVRMIILQLLNEANLELLESSIEQFKITDKSLLKLLDYFKNKQSDKKVTSTQEIQPEQEQNYQKSLLSGFKNITSKIHSHGKGLVSKITGGSGKDVAIKVVENILSKNTLSEDLKGLGFSYQNFNKQSKQKLPNTIIVYCPEGLTYNEFIGFQELSKKLKKNIVCGGSIMLNADDFFRQLLEII